MLAIWKQQVEIVRPILFSRLAADSCTGGIYPRREDFMLEANVLLVGDALYLPTLQKRFIHLPSCLVHKVLPRGTAESWIRAEVPLEMRAGRFGDRKV